jgi:hypothetical protein
MTLEKMPVGADEAGDPDLAAERTIAFDNQLDAFREGAQIEFDGAHAQSSFG